MSAGAAIINVAGGVAQVAACRRQAGHIRVSLGLVERAHVRSIATYCFYQSVWTVGMLCVSGLDVAIVGHYDYGQTAYYALAAMPTSFLSAVIASLLGPIMPASSALSTRRSAEEMGAILVTITRYSTVILLLTGLSATVLGFPLLRLWVGGDYAGAVLPYLRVLMIANIIRNLCLPYATMLCGTGCQRAATFTAVAEAIVNVSCSIALAGHYGAIGVAVGTLIGSFVSVALHFATTMRLARKSISVPLSSFLLKGLLRPLVVAIPSLLLLTNWGMPATFVPRSLALWGISTLLLAWLFAIDAGDRRNLLNLARGLFPPTHGDAIASTAK
jgi:O-antigen/teichoic acid export membrane protein